VGIFKRRKEEADIGTLGIVFNSRDKDGGGAKPREDGKETTYRTDFDLSPILRNNEEGQGLPGTFRVDGSKSVRLKGQQ